MLAFRLRPMLFAAGGAAAALLLYGALFGLHTLGRPELELQLHNTYLVLPPGYALALLALLLSPATAAIYLLLKPRPARLAVWLTGLGALLLIYAIGSLSESLTYLCPVGLIRISQAEAPNQIPADSFLARLLPVLRVLQVLMGGLTLLAGHALGRRSRQTPAPGPN